MIEVEATISREALLGKLAVGRQRRVDVPEWGTAVTIRELSVGEFSILESAKRDPAGTAVKILLTALVSPRLAPEDADALRAAGHAGVNRVVAAVMDLSGLSVAGRAVVEGN